MEQETLATEMLRELKATSKRWFIAFITVLILWFATIGIFIWYISLPVEEYETYEVEQQSDRNSANNVIGGDYYGFDTESNKENIQAKGN